MPTLSHADVLNRRDAFAACYGVEALDAFGLPDAGTLTKHQRDDYLAKLDATEAWLEERGIDGEELAHEWASEHELERVEATWPRQSPEDAFRDVKPEPEHQAAQAPRAREVETTAPVPEAETAAPVSEHQGTLEAEEAASGDGGETPPSPERSQWLLDIARYVQRRLASGDAEWLRAARHVQELLDQGLGVIAIRPSQKAPHGDRWRTRVHTLESLTAWLKQGGNLGIRIRPDQLVLDYDPRNDPAHPSYTGGPHVPDPRGNSLERFAAAVGLDLATCPTTRTPSGGLHLFLRVPLGLRFRNQLADFPGLEFKAFGRQVLAPPSVHPKHLDGPRYTRDLTRRDYGQAPEVPAKLLEMVSRPAPAPREPGSGTRSGGSHQVSPKYLERILSTRPAEEFQVHDTWLEVMMAAHAATDGDLEARDVFVVWSTSDPLYSGHGEIINGRWDSFEANEPGGITAATLFHHFPEAPHPPAEEAFEGVEPEPVEALPTNEPEKARGPRLLTLREFLDAVKPAPPIVDGFLYGSGVFVLFGRWGLGKTYLALDLGLHVAHGFAQWHGRQLHLAGRVA